MPEDLTGVTRERARRLVQALREAGTSGIVQGLVREYDLSTREGVALMCLAEALLRIPDVATRDALIRDKIGKGDWRRHVGGGASLFVNAATWGLVVTGGLLKPGQPRGLSGALTDVLTRCGEPVIRRGVDMAMRMMGAQFVTGQTIGQALENGAGLVKQGFCYSFDMLGEAAATAEDATRYYRDYEQAIHAIGCSAARRGVYAGPGISVKLSALHPRYGRLQRDRVLAELLPRVLALAVLAKGYDIGFNIDAEEADRLELSLDLLEALCLAPELSGWNGIGFVVQAYQKRAPYVLDWVIDLARRSGHRIMVRLVKGAYWDSEIKRAQVEGLSDFPVFTTKLHTDVSYLACARKLLGAPEAVFPQFATHNAQTVASIYAYAGKDFYLGRYEFQCLHGMGEPLYRQIIGERPVRIYAPVGTHETLLAYLVRRLLENGANSSFVNRIQDESVTVDDLTADPVSLVREQVSPIRLPGDLFLPERANSAGLDLTDEDVLRDLAGSVMSGAKWGSEGQEIFNPADRSDCVGRIAFASRHDVEAALARADGAVSAWGAVSAEERGAMLGRAADGLEAHTPQLLGLIVREAGKTYVNAVAEIREAVDFLRYYGARAPEDGVSQALGAVACISPWNFPLAIFIGQVAAALAAGNTVLAKPAEETPLIAAEAVRILHEAGVPLDVLHLLPGGGDVGAHLVGDARVRGVLFTGSTEVARLIQASLAGRINPDGQAVPLIAETGGQNALIVDSSALPEQVVRDVLASAFDSAGQRCSALRVLCLQEESADRILAMLRGAMAELHVGRPDDLSVDIGPVISEAARETILSHIEEMRKAGFGVHQAALSDACGSGIFVPPTLIEIDSLSALKREVFGPVLHVLRFARADMERVVDAINATGYALTFGVHSRIDDTVARVSERSDAGNIYINRNLVGAVVGVQPFGGHGLSGTGPKAGGPLYLRRLLSRRPALDAVFMRRPLTVTLAYRAWLTEAGLLEDVLVSPTTPVGAEIMLPGPVGEENVYRLKPRGVVLCVGPMRRALVAQMDAALATGNRVVVPEGVLAELPARPAALAAMIGVYRVGDAVDVALLDGDAAVVRDWAGRLAEREGPIVGLHGPDAEGLYPLEWLVVERTVSTDTTAAGGNAALMMA